MDDRNAANEVRKLADQARSALGYLYDNGGKDWSYPAIAVKLNEATGRSMDASFARRFIVDDAKGPKFSPAEIVRVHHMATNAKAEFESAYTGAAKTGLSVAFNTAAQTLSVEIPLGPHAESLKDDAAFENFMKKSVQNAFDLYLSIPKDRGGPA